MLIDRWPGVAWPVQSPPTDGFTGADHHDVVTAAFLVGTKVQVYNHSSVAGLDGWSIFMYAKLEEEDATNVTAARVLCVAESGGTPYDLTNEVATDLGPTVSPVAVCLGALTENSFGWYFVGGVVPEEWVSGLGGFYGADATTAAVDGACLMTTRDLSDADTTYGEIGFSKVNADTELLIGIAFATAVAV